MTNAPRRFGFWFCGLLWLYLPFLIAKHTWGEISKAVAVADAAAKTK
jgi:hypothetical protein